MRQVPEWRRTGLAACYTVDAGPNVHVICSAEDAPLVRSRLVEIPGVQQVFTAFPGGPAQLTESR